MVSKQQEKKIWKKVLKIEESIKDMKLKEKARNKKIIKRNKNIRFPKKINILENEWTIEFSEDLHKAEEKVNGLCYKHNRTISLCLTNKEIVQTLLHELQHGIDAEFGDAFSELWKLRRNKTFDEFRVKTISGIWLDIFKQLRGEVKNAV